MTMTMLMKTVAAMRTVATTTMTVARTVAVVRVMTEKEEERERRPGKESAPAAGLTLSAFKGHAGEVRSEFCARMTARGLFQDHAT